ncbi:MAG: Fpg/Nei family DNA glycosylase [Micromonosporaceae bacterium]|nr:Fpg/Nei family DNA glycosylase [Micromonosporaceae bacterium]
MPEGDTVWNTARVLDRALAGSVIRHSDFRVPALATVDLAKWRVRGCVSRGKHLLLRLSGPGDGQLATLHSHLRMDGAWRVFGPGEPWRGRPAHEIRVVLRTLTTVAVGYHLHDLALVPTEQEQTLVGHLGPDLLGSPDEVGGWDPDEAVRRLRARPERTIAEALLDQRNLAGIGNLYKAEVLFLRGIHPRTPVGDVADLEAVVELAHKLLMANRGRWTQATTGSVRRGEESYVYGRAGAPCRRCGTLIERDSVGERVTFWCPSCQPARAPQQAATAA